MRRDGALIPSGFECRRGRRGRDCSAAHQSKRVKGAGNCFSFLSGKGRRRRTTTCFVEQVSCCWCHEAACVEVLQLVVGGGLRSRRGFRVEEWRMRMRMRTGDSSRQFRLGAGGSRAENRIQMGRNKARSAPCAVVAEQLARRHHIQWCRSQHACERIGMMMNGGGGNTVVAEPIRFEATSDTTQQQIFASTIVSPSVQKSHRRSHSYAAMCEA